MAEKAVAEVKDTGKDLLEKITDMDVFRREDQVKVKLNRQKYFMRKY